MTRPTLSIGLANYGSTYASGEWHRFVDLGRAASIEAPAQGLRASQRQVLPLIELRADFAVARSELRDLDRGAVDTDFSAVDSAARRIAEAENVAVFHGWKAAGIVGVAQAAPHPSLTPGKKFAEYPVPATA